MVIWKTILELTDVQTIEIPGGAEILCAREQSERICIWYRCDPHKEKESRKIAIVGTGKTTPSVNDRYLGTASLHGGQYMFHVFEQRPA